MQAAFGSRQPDAVFHKQLKWKQVRVAKLTQVAMLLCRPGGWAGRSIEPPQLVPTALVQAARAPTGSGPGQMQALRARRLSADGPTDIQLARLRAGDGAPLVSAAQPGGFLDKLRAAWRIFFPERPPMLSPKEEGKNRLRMILVADR